MSSDSKNATQTGNGNTEGNNDGNPGETSGGKSGGKKTNAGMKHGFVVCEFGNSRNQNIFFPPSIEVNQTNSIIRGRWERANLKSDRFSERAAAMEGMPPIPGGCLAIDFSAKRAIIFDPLEDKAKDIVQEVRRILNVSERTLRTISDIHRRSFGKAVVPFPARTISDMIDDQVKSWVFWLQRCLKEEMARVLLGNMPDFADLPGNTRVDYTGNYPGVPRHKEGWDKLLANSNN